MDPGGAKEEYVKVISADPGDQTLLEKTPTLIETNSCRPTGGARLRSRYPRVVMRAHYRSPRTPGFIPGAAPAGQLELE
jgi:hypothetical protein